MATKRLTLAVLAQPQQVVLLSLLQLQQDAFVAIAGVTAHESRTPIAERTFAEFAEQPPSATLACPLLCCLPVEPCTSSTRRRLPTKKVCSM
jgi:hypothetical protein